MEIGLSFCNEGSQISSRDMLIAERSQGPKRRERYRPHIVGLLSFRVGIDLNPSNKY